MKRSDIGVTALVYAFTLFFLYMTLELPPDAQTYPLCLIAGLLVLNTCYLVRCLWQLRRQAGIHNDLPDLFAGFQWKQFAFICLGCVGYMLLMYVAGFYIASICCEQSRKLRICVTRLENSPSHFLSLACFLL